MKLWQQCPGLHPDVPQSTLLWTSFCWRLPTSQAVWSVDGAARSPRGGGIAHRLKRITAGVTFNIGNALQPRTRAHAWLFLTHAAVISKLEMVAIAGSYQGSGAKTCNIPNNSTGPLLSFDRRDYLGNGLLKSRVRPLFLSQESVRKIDSRLALTCACGNLERSTRGAV